MKNVCNILFRTTSNFIRRNCHYINKSQEYMTVYRLPIIGFCSLINKVRKPQICCAGTVVPVTYGLHAADILALNDFIAFTTVGIASTAAVFICSQFFTRLIGFVYVNKEEVKIAYIDPWGKRVDAAFKLNDIQSVEDSIWPMSHFYKHVFVSSSKKPYKLCTKYGEVLDSVLFKKVFHYDPSEYV